MQFTSAGMLNRWGTMDTEAVTSRNWRAKNRKASHNAYKDPVILWNYPGSIRPAPSGCHVFTSKAELQTALGEWIDNETTATEKYGEISCWDVTAVTNFSNLLYGIDGTGVKASSFNSDISNWNTENVTNMKGAFRSATIFNQPLNSWNVSSVKNMSRTFELATSFNKNIGSWNVSGVTDMNKIFSYTTVFNNGESPDIGNWNVAAVTDMEETFRESIAFNQPIGSWNVGSVEKMNGMFQFALIFNQDITGWNVGSVEIMQMMFKGAPIMSQNIWVWDVGMVNPATGFNNIFDSATDMLAISNGASLPDNNAQAVTGGSQPGDWFRGPVAYTFTERGWSDTDPTYAPAVGTLFYAVDLYSNDASRNNAIALYGDINTWQFDYTGNLKNLSELFFYNANAARPTDVSGFNFDIDNWDVSGVTTMEKMFKKTNIFNRDIGNWNTITVVDMQDMFREAIVFDNSGSSTINNWNVSGVTDMNNMFRQAYAFNQNIGSWNVSEVTDMSKMFLDCSFNQDISGWNVNNVTNMTQMFSGATDMSQNIWVWDVCGNATFTNIFLDSSMIYVPNNDGYLPDEDASANGAGPGTWFTGPPPYIFTSRGWDGVTTYDPAADTLFYAVDLYSNDASNSQAISLYGDINTWQFDYNASVPAGESLKDFSELFYSDADAARPSDISGFNFDISDWDVSGVTNMERMFGDANVFNQNLSNWNTSNVNNMTAMFQYAKSFNNSGVALTWNTSNVTNMTAMFDGYKYRLEGGNQFNQDISGWDVGIVVEMAAMFQYAPAFNQDIGGWNVGNVTDMTLMFRNGGGVIPSGSFNQDISGWNVSNVTNMQSMFFNQIDMSQNIWAWDVCGNANFQNIFIGATKMLTVSNDAGQTPNIDACGNSVAGDWFTG